MAKQKRQSRGKRIKPTGDGLLSILKGAAKLGLKLGKSKVYKSMGVLGVGGKNTFRRKAWEV